MKNFQYRFTFGESRYRCILVFAALVFCWLPFVAVCDAHGKIESASAIDQVRDTVDSILDILNEENVFEDKWPERKEEIVSLIKERFDFRELSKRALGKHWKKRSLEEKDEFIILFQKVLQNTYIERLKCYSNEKIVFYKQVVKGEKALVYCAFLRNDTKIPMKYRARRVNGSWYIYDIIIEGVSLVSNYRKQFTQIIRKEQYDGLITKMKQKVLTQSECFRE